IGRRDQRRWIATAGFKMMERRISIDKGKIMRIIRAAVVTRPGPTYGKLLEPQHIHYADGRQRRPIQIGPLSHGCADQQSAIAATTSAELWPARVLLLDQVFRRRDEIIKDVLLDVFFAGLMPFLPILTSTAQICDGVKAAHLHPVEKRRIK